METVSENMHGCSPTLPAVKVVVVVMVVVVVVAFSYRARIWGRMFDNSLPTLHFFFSSFFFKMEISSRTLIPFFMSGSVYSGSASGDDCGRMYPDKLRVSSFPVRFPHYAWAAA